jgi:hypothetical protein
MSAARIATSAFASSSAESGVEPAEPWVSTTISWPAAFAATSSDSAAMYVCAMPVGHAVTATMRIRPRPRR